MGKASVASVKPQTRQGPGHFCFTRAPLSQAAGARDLGISLIDIESGKAAWPHHWHGVEEELIYILEGSGTMRYGEHRLPVKEGDYISFPPAFTPEAAHQLVNTSQTVLRYLCGSNTSSAEFCGYPDSQKLVVVSEKPFKMHKMLDDSQPDLDYYSREAGQGMIPKAASAKPQPFGDPRQHVASAHSVPLEEGPCGDQGMFAPRRRPLSRAAGGQSLGCSLVEMQPGKAGWPLHHHWCTEEAIFVLSGRGTMRIGSEEMPAAPGDYFAHLPGGSQHAHQLRNTSEETLKYLCFSANKDFDCVGYPNSGKLAVRASTPQGEKFGKLFMADCPDKQYYDGE